MVWAFVLVLVLGVIYAVGRAIAKLATIICFLFSLSFWAGILLLLTGLILGMFKSINQDKVIGIVDWSYLCFAFAGFMLIPVLIEMLITGIFTPDTALRFEHLLFPWMRLAA